VRDGLAGRAIRLVVGCVLLGVGVALMVLARLGLAPWDVLHQGISTRTGMPIGTVGILVGIVVLAAWIPLKQPYGIGTLVNVVLVGVSVDGALALAPSPPHYIAVRAACLIAGVVTFSLGTALYVGAGLGPGPRDGLMTALSARRNQPVGGVRTAIELTVLLGGWLLGGRVGVGTVLFAFAVGPLLQRFLGSLTVPIPTLTPPSE
jgi:uncharacterized membrane protein YczE